jgi:DNA helicase-2/ATP-dependent DNA helicase PcrA
VVERAVQLIKCNRERFAKTIRPRPAAAGRLVLAPDAGDEPGRTTRLLAAMPADDGSWAVLARTNRELLPAVVAALELGMPFRAAGLSLLVDDPPVDGILERVESATDDRLPLLVRLGWLRRVGTAAEGAGEDTDIGELLAAMLAWAAPFRDLDAFRAAIAERRERLAELRRDDARLTLATAHSTKGLEFDHVAVVGMEAGRFPSGRAVGEAPEPDRAFEEERRLAYVAWTRARRSLTLSYDPTSPSPFLLEAFTPEELGLPDTMAP